MEAFYSVFNFINFTLFYHEKTSCNQRFWADWPGGRTDFDGARRCFGSGACGFE